MIFIVVMVAMRKPWVAKERVSLRTVRKAMLPTMSEETFSSYYSALQEKAKTRYREKLRILGKMADPFANWQPGPSLDWQEWPDVRNMAMSSTISSSPQVSILASRWKPTKAWTLTTFLQVVGWTMYQSLRYTLAGTRTWSLLWFATHKRFQPRLYKRGWQPNKMVEWFVDTARAWQD